MGRVFVMRVSPEGPAEKTGLEVGDIVLKVGKEPVEGLSDLYRKVWALGRAGVKVPLSVLQGTEIHNITIHSGDRYRYLRLRPRRKLDYVESLRIERLSRVETGPTARSLRAGVLKRQWALALITHLRIDSAKDLEILRR
jgi:hypothetical protein